MKAIQKIITLSVFFGLVFTSTQLAFAQTTAKIGWVDLRRIYEESEEFQKVSQELQDQRNQRQQELESKRMSLAEKINEFQVSRDLLPEKTQEQRVNELKQEERSFYEEMQQEQMELEALKDERLQPLIQELKETVEAIAAEEGYAMIFKKFYIAFGDPSYDITAKVIARMNQ